MKNAALIAFFIFVGLASFLEINHAYKPGGYVCHDSVYYIGIARELLAGEGYLMERMNEGELTSIYPPGYPFAITALGIVGIEPLNAAGWVNILFFTGSCLLLSWVAFRHFRTPWCMALPPLMFMLNTDLIRAHESAMSEPMFMFFMILGFHFLGLHLNTPRRSWLIIGSLGIGIAFLSRFAGIMLPPLVFLVFLLYRRWKDAFIAGALSVFPMSLFVLRNYFVNDTLKDRVIQVNWIPQEKLLKAAEFILNWFAFNNHAGHWRILEAGLLIGIPALGICWQLKQARRLPPLITLLIGFTFLYPAFIVTHITFVEPATPLDQRMLGPILPCIYLLLGYGWSCWWRSRFVFWGYAILSLVICTFIYKEARYQLDEFHRWGPGGYTGRKWMASQTLATAKTFPENTTVYSNAFDAFYLHHPLNIKRVPQNLSDDQLRAMIQDLTLSKGYLIISDNIYWRKRKDLERRLQEELNIQPIHTFPDGRIYQF